jgi:hypothetical protein
MPSDKLKRLARARQKRTGESYTTARTQLNKTNNTQPSPTPAGEPPEAEQWKRRFVEEFNAALKESLRKSVQESRTTALQQRSEMEQFFNDLLEKQKDYLATREDDLAQAKERVRLASSRDERRFALSSLKYHEESVKSAREFVSKLSENVEKFRTETAELEVQWRADPFA